MMRDSIMDLHRAAGVELVPAFTEGGKLSKRAFFGPGRVRIRIISRLRAALAVLFGRDSGVDGGVQIVDFGKDRDGGPTSPMVILDWGTYMQLILGLRRERMKNIELSPEHGSPEAKAQENEIGGGSFQ